MQPGRDRLDDGEDGFIVSVLVAVSPERAFEAFTDQIDLWWLRGPKHRFRPPYHDGMLRFEPGPGGTLKEHYPDGSAFTIGRILDWRPGELLRLTWRLPSFAPAQRTEVCVRFEPEAGQTRVSVEHRGFATLPADHPARHGRRGRDLAFIKGALWAEVLTALRDHVNARGSTT